MARITGACGWSIRSRADTNGNRRTKDNSRFHEDSNLLTIITARKARLDKIKRFDMPGFRPNRHYLREMKSYGVLPPDFDIENDPVDPYELDRRYWESLRHRPIQTTRR